MLGYRLAADALLLLHVGFVLFVVVGLAVVWIGAWRGWRWVRSPYFRIAHLLCIGVVVLQAWLGRICPLTIWEMALRERAGEATYDGAFIAHWLETLLYYDAPMWVFAVVYTAFAALVIASWIWVPPSRS
ncbi:MAG: DUF2784 domain-containing protein [Pseudomonadota bacterium]